MRALSTKLLKPSLLGLSIALAGCAGLQTQDPYTGQTQTSNTAKGSAIGAIGGAILGAVVSDDAGKGALIGAGIGGLAGAGIGNYMDEQEATLRRELRRTGVRVIRNGNNIQLVMPGNITFATGSPDINASFYPVLDSVSKILDEFDQTSISISGHTDSTGSRQLNNRLSLSRAESVSAYLRSQGVNPLRITTTGYADRYPLASNATSNGRQQNRRVEIVLHPVSRG